MRRNIISQMLREWKDNIWLVIGIAVVSMAIWFFINSLMTVLQNYFTPLGFEADNVYIMDIGRHRSNSAEYVDAGADTKAMNDQDLRTLIARIRNNSNVEYAGFSNNGAPYSGTFGGNNIRRRFPLDTMFYLGNTRSISPDVINVLKFKSTTGKDSEYLRKKLAAGEILLSHTDPEKVKGSYRTAEEIGREVCNWDTTKVRYVADVIYKIRRNAYEEHDEYGDIVYPIDENLDLDDAYEILVRVKPGSGKKFKEDFQNDPELSTQRNIFIRNCVALSEKGKIMERKNNMKVRIHIAVVVFMVIIIFLGLLGTFWFRTQQRVSEIAIRRTCGATRGDIFRRIMSEGMILLVAASVVAGGIGWMVIHHLKYDEQYGLTSLAWAELFTFAAVAVGILLSVAVPAWIAMRIDPAVAVKDE